MDGDVTTRAIPATAQSDVAHAESVGSVVGPITVPIYRTQVRTALMARTKGNCSMVVASMVAAILVEACSQACMEPVAGCTVLAMVV
jgi:hypothetical protein